MNEILTEDNFLLFAAKSYHNPGCYDTTEFIEDLNRLKYLKRLFNRYDANGELKERLILNHLIVLYNVFGSDATKLLIFRLEDHLVKLVTFLGFLDRMPNEVKGIWDADFVLQRKDVPILTDIDEALKKL